VHASLTKATTRRGVLTREVWSDPNRIALSCTQSSPAGRSTGETDDRWHGLRLTRKQGATPTGIEVESRGYDEAHSAAIGHEGEGSEEANRAPKYTDPGDGGRFGTLASQGEDAADSTSGMALAEEGAHKAVALARAVESSVGVGDVGLARGHALALVELLGSSGPIDTSAQAASRP
jgi:hypothetical protein